LAYLLHRCGPLYHPELDEGVPATRNNHGGVLVHETRHIFDWGVVSAHNCELVRFEVPLENTMVCTRHQHRHIILLPTDPEYRSLADLLVQDWFRFKLASFFVSVCPHADEATES
jgi:hypothetical protein